MFRIAGTGICLPETIVTAEDLETRHDLHSGRLQKTPGVARRRYCSSETQITMAAKSARDALFDAGISPCDLDLIVFASAVSYQPIPSTSAILMGTLGIEDGTVETFDLNTTCLSFLSALDKVGKMMRGGAYRRVLIVSSEVASRALPWDTDPETAALFGDGAAAAVITPDPTIRVESLFRTYPSGWEHCQIRSGGTRYDFKTEAEEFARHATFQMNGRELYRATLKTFPTFVSDLLRKSNSSVDQVDTIIPHQASPHAIAHMKKACDFTDEQVVETIQNTGNMIAASIPFTLHQARSAGRLRAGCRIMMLGTSAGLSLGGMTMDIPK